MNIPHTFRDHLLAGRLPAPVSAVSWEAAGLTRSALADLLESQLFSRHLDLGSRRLAQQKRSYYSIGSSGHEGNAAVARALRLTDMAFLHYRSGAFLLERARQNPGETPLWDMALSFVASSDDPCSGGRHKVLGSKSLFIPPQTSTIASHLPKASGAAFAVTLAKKLRKLDAVMPRDAVVLASFGDASANHSTAQGAFNTAAWCVARGLHMPIIFLCEDNGLGISVPTPSGWIAQNFSGRPHLTYIASDGRDVADAFHAARRAAAHARTVRTPVFLHMKTVRLMGHAGSDVETGYRDAPSIAAEQADDPLLHSARIAVEAGVASLEDVTRLDAELQQRVSRIMEAASQRPVLSSLEHVAQPLLPPAQTSKTAQSNPRSSETPPVQTSKPAAPLHLSRMIAQTLGALMEADPSLVLMGEDVGAKGGVYGATAGLQKRLGPTRVFDSPLDEQSILGTAIGLAHNGFLPIPEIQFLAYVHNAEDQIRGEAATLSFFSNGQFSNPMVIRVAGLGYQKGFGGHFHNDNALGVFRDIPGLIVACPSSAREAALMLRECVRLAREERRVVVFLEPIAIYPLKDLHQDGDGLMASIPPAPHERAVFGAPSVYEEAPAPSAATAAPADLAIITYGNGVRLSRQAAATLRREGRRVRVVDVRWLAPLNVDAVREAAGDAQALLIVDECRRSGSLSEELLARLYEAGVAAPIARLTGADCFVPLGPAATLGMPSVDAIVEAAEAVMQRREGPQSPQVVWSVPVPLRVNGAAAPAAHKQATPGTPEVAMRAPAGLRRANRETAVVICPGRGDYGRDQLGYLQRYHADKTDFLDGVDAFRVAQDRKPVRALDTAPRYSAALHAVSENASALTYACALADLADIDRDRFDIVAVTGNSLGWYLALAAGGALNPQAAITLVDTMGALMAEQGVGGQLVYPLVDEAWRPCAQRRAAVDGALETVNGETPNAVFWSIKLGGLAVLAGTEEGLARLQALLPPAEDGRYPFRLARHAAFHTPLLSDIAAQAAQVLPASLFQAPDIPLIDGRGVVWRSWGTDLEALHAYTLGHQVTQTYDFSRALTTALKEFAPDRLIITGPGTSLGPPVAHTLIAQHWLGLTDKPAFMRLQGEEPFVLSMGRPEQRAKVVRADRGGSKSPQSVSEASHV